MNDIRKYFKYLYSLERSSMKYDLKNIKLLLEASGNPHHKIKFIHIAGTNGKGGTASFLASILKEHGLKTGLFTSPHIIRFNERIRVNGKTITDSYIKNFLDKNKKLIEKIKPSFFEVNTALAFNYFHDKKVDIAVIETGLGGRLDSTNIVKPELIIITQIGIDHTDYLGNTLESIAKEKLGIVKPSIDVIVSDTNKILKKIFTSYIKPERLYYLDKHVNAGTLSTSIRESKFRFNLKKSRRNLILTSPISGKYQSRNIASALLASKKYLSDSGIIFSEAKIRKAVKNIKTNTGYRCRFEIIKTGKVNYIFDISHNPAGIKSALGNLGSIKPSVIIFAMMNDKDYKSAVKDILKTGSKIIFTQPAYKRAIPANILFEYAKGLRGVKEGEIFLCADIQKALKQAHILAGKSGYILIMGSFFLVSEAIKKLKLQKLFK